MRLRCKTKKKKKTLPAPQAMLSMPSSNRAAQERGCCVWAVCEVVENVAAAS